MTERQKALLKALPECNNNVAKAGRIAGYSESTVQGKLYNLVRNSKGFSLDSEEKVRNSYLRKVKKAQRKMELEKDNTNYIRTMELEGRVLGVTNKDTLKHEGDTPTNIVVNYGTIEELERIRDMEQRQGVRPPSSDVIDDNRPQTSQTPDLKPPLQPIENKVVKEEVNLKLQESILSESKERSPEKDIQV